MTKQNFLLFAIILIPNQNAQPEMAQAHAMQNFNQGPSGHHGVLLCGHATHEPWSLGDWEKPAVLGTVKMTTGFVGWQPVFVAEFHHVLFTTQL